MRIEEQAWAEYVGACRAQSFSETRTPFESFLTADSWTAQKRQHPSTPTASHCINSLSTCCHSKGVWCMDSPFWLHCFERKRPLVSNLLLGSLQVADTVPGRVLAPIFPSQPCPGPEQLVGNSEASCFPLSWCSQHMRIQSVLATPRG